MSSAEMTSDGPMTTRIPPILRLVFAACTVGLFGELPKAEEPPAGSLHTADLLTRCLAIEPARPAFAKEAMVPYVARLALYRRGGQPDRHPQGAVDHLRSVQQARAGACLDALSRKLAPAG